MQSQIKVAGETKKPSLRQNEFYKYWKYKYLTLLFLIPIIYYIIFHYIPLYGIQIAFKDFKFRQGMWGSSWVGFYHFREMFSMNSFWQVTKNTILISFYRLLFGFPAPIIFAILLNEIKQRRFKKTVQTISYLPHFVSWVVLGGLFMQFLSPSMGPINLFLGSIGMKPIYFLADPKWFRSVLILTGIWKGIGWGSIIYLATLSSIDPQLYEAAIVDGANRFKQIIHITLPSLTPVITIMLIFAVGSIINEDFNQIFNLYNPAVYRVADVLETYVYRRGLIQMEYSFATAVNLFKNLIAFVLIMTANATAKRINEYGIW